MLNIVEHFTGRGRPRHRRFAEALKALAAERQIQIEQSWAADWQRACLKAEVFFRGVRSVPSGFDNADGVMLHQAVMRSPTTPYICEFDLPLGLHNYRIAAHRSHSTKARSLLEHPNLKKILVFSEWSKRSFALHFGSSVHDKCEVVYPLALERNVPLPAYENRRYDFVFISTDFQIKSGPQLVDAFKEIIQRHPNAALCIVTNLEQARDMLGTLDLSPQITWKAATLDENEIADLLLNSRCLVHPSLIDSFGVVALEALAAGCALITTDIASFPEMNRHQENGLMFTPPWSAVTGDDFITEFGDVAYARQYLNILTLDAITHALHSNMSYMLKQPEQCKRMMAASAALYEKQFSHAAWRRKMTSVLADAFDA